MSFIALHSSSAWGRSIWARGLALALALICVLIGGRLAAQEQTPAPQAVQKPAPQAVQKTAPQAVKVGLYVSPPFVMKEGERYTGMAVELWEIIAAKLNLAPEYKEFQNYTEIVQAVASGAVDVGVTNLSITEDRAKSVDFTQPWYDAGLRVMTRANAGASFSDIVGSLADAGHLEAYAWIAGAILLFTLLLTLFDRIFDKEFPRAWSHGLAESFYHVMSVATSGKTEHHKHLFGPLGTVFAALWMVGGVAMVAYITSSITSVMTAAQITNKIDNVADLQGKVVGVRAGSVAESYVKSAGIKTRPYNHMAQAADALLRGEVSAIVGDSPVLEYYAHVNPSLPLSVVGGAFQPEKYGFAFTTGNKMTKPASIAIIGAQESGELEKLRARYFGFKS